MVLTVYVDAFGRRVVNVLFSETGDQVLTDDRVESPTLVASGYFLSHGGQKALRVKKPSHPKHLRIETSNKMK